MARRVRRTPRAAPRRGGVVSTSAVGPARQILQSLLYVVVASLVLIIVYQPRPRASPIPLAAPRVSDQDCRDCWVTFNPVESGTATVGEHRPGRPPGIRCTVRLAQFSRAAPCARCSCSFRVQPLAHAIAPRSSRAPSHRGGVGGGPRSRRARIDVLCKPSFLHRGISGILFLVCPVCVLSRSAGPLLRPPEGECGTKGHNTDLVYRLYSSSCTEPRLHLTQLHVQFVTCLHLSPCLRVAQGSLVENTFVPAVVVCLCCVVLC